MTRTECEKQIEKKFREIIDIYHQYNPDGKYLALAYVDDDGDGHISVNNRCWDACDETGREVGEDINFPIDFYAKKPLTIETFNRSPGMLEKIVTGFGGEALEELNKLYSEDKGAAEERAIEIIDRRNGNIGTCWARGYGIYGFRVADDGCVFTIGNSCD